VPKPSRIRGDHLQLRPFDALFQEHIDEAHLDKVKKAQLQHSIDHTIIGPDDRVGMAPAVLLREVVPGEPPLYALPGDSSQPLSIL